ncbi:glycoside hydrolase family 79 protein [Ceratobasidium sp. AG-Ba]|nr:glycoside hydrolase family 79 protein [Ceratobasidium sp. AG-Ba]
MKTNWSALAAVLTLSPIWASAVTIYTVLPGQTPSGFVEPAAPTFLTAPAPPPAGPKEVQIQPASASARLSKPHRPDFVGFSIELSISDRLIGTNGSWINPIFLNFIQNIRARQGKVPIRLGGNSQDHSAVFPPLTFGNRTLTKEDDPLAQNRNTNPPLVAYTQDLFHAMASISQLVAAEWVVGLPFMNTSYISSISQSAQDILGTNLIGLQLGNEPDIYAKHDPQFQNWTGPASYFPEFQSRLDMVSGPKNNIYGPSVCCSWKPEDVIAAGYLTQFGNNLKSFSVQHYAENGCSNTTPPTVIDPPSLFVQLLNHTAATSFGAEYVNASNLVQAAGKEIIMLETNSVSCGGLDGVSDSFGSALFAIDNALQLASIGFSQVFFHSGGAASRYNAFSVPPGNQTYFQEWTVGSTFYAILALSETIGKSGASQIADLQIAGANSIYTPAYTIVENGNPTKVALFNFVSDASGASDYEAVITVPSTQGQVRVKYLYGDSVSAKQNITWAGQTLGQTFHESDGRLMGNLDIQTIQCQGGSCRVPMKAPSFALVFLSDQALNDITPVGPATETFATSVITRQHGRILVDPSVLATSNGDGGSQELLKAKWQATSERSASTGTKIGVSAGLFLGLVVGAAATLMGSRM